ncbi:hypothetical protein PM082_012026 [Marasmius tenuissimus]|nr:hypothetical protein PM082_012026 [Marasmius tenuissimus]
MLTVTLIRHGESEDNTQAAAAGKYFSTTQFTAIYASPLLRAYQTAEAVRDGSQQQPPLTIIKNPKLREQYFGIAEGKPWEAAMPQDSYPTLEEAYANGVFPVLVGRDERFPEGESLNDLGRRTAEAIQECVLPHLQGSNSDEDRHIILASHGLCISELVSALVKLDPEADTGVDYRGLLNTAWTRAAVSLKDPSSKDFDASKPPALNVKITDFNISKHLDEVGAIPVKSADAKQAFFAGQTDAAEANATSEKL